MSFERLNGSLRRLFGRVRIDAGRSSANNVAALTVNQDSVSTANLLDLQDGGESKCYVDSEGRLYTPELRVPLGGVIGATITSPNNYALVQGLTTGWTCPHSGWGFRTGTGNSAAVDVRIQREDVGVLAQRSATTPQAYRLYGSWTSATAYQRLSTTTLREAVTAASGASVTTTISIPKYTHLIGVATRVTTDLGVTNGTTGYTVGDGTDPDLWGAVTGVAGGTTTDRRDFTAVAALGPDGSDRTITLTAVGGNFDGAGVIEVCAFYLAAEAD
jgi:hypothetical protein